MRAASDDQGKREEIQKAKAAIRERVEAGYFHGEPPLVLTFDGEKRYLEASDEFETIKRVFELLDRGVPYTEISEEVGLATGTVSKIKSMGVISMLSTARFSWLPLGISLSDMMDGFDTIHVY